MIIASGVSSTINSTPVAASSARMLRPSRPIIFPLISSDSMLKTDTQFSIAFSAAVRWMVSITTFLASFVAVNFASSIACFTMELALDSASAFNASISCWRASSAERFAIFSNWLI